MNIFKSLGFGISMGCTVFVTVNLIGYWIKGDLFLDAVMATFPQQVLGSIIVGIACILPSYIYRIERLTFLQQSACHFFYSYRYLYSCCLFFKMDSYIFDKTNYPIVAI